MSRKLVASLLPWMVMAIATAAGKLYLDVERLKDHERFYHGEFRAPGVP